MENVLIGILATVVSALLIGAIVWYFKRGDKTTESTQRLEYTSETQTKEFSKLEDKISKKFELLFTQNSEIKQSTSKTETNVLLMQKDLSFEVERGKTTQQKVSELEADVKDGYLKITEALSKNNSTMLIVADAIKELSIANNRLAEATSNHIKDYKPKN